MLIGPGSFESFAKLECPQCGGKLLRGPRAGHLNQNVTCRSCALRYNLFVIAKDNTMLYEYPMTDTDFINRVAVIGWEYTGMDDAGAAYYNPTKPKRNCDFCNEEYTGPAVYCCLACAIADA